MQSPDLTSVVLIILNVVLTAGVGIIIFFMRDYRVSIDRRFFSAEKKHDKLADDFSDFKAQLPHHFVLRDDFVRAMIGFDSKIDKLSKDIREIVRSLKRGKA